MDYGALKIARCNSVARAIFENIADGKTSDTVIPSCFCEGSVFFRMWKIQTADPSQKQLGMT
jgi:hypothetical protein